MNFKELIKSQIYLFFPTLGVTFLVTKILAFVLGYDAILLAELFFLVIFAVVCTLGIAVYYSKKELSKEGLALRTLIHLAFVLKSATILMLSAGWISLELSYLAITLPLQTLGYGTVVALDNVHSRRVAKNFNKALEEFHERYKKDTQD